jgi:hypothetical protein
VNNGMDPEEKMRKRVEIYARRVETREKFEWKSREELVEGEKQGVGSIMKRKLTPGHGVGEDVVPEWSTRGENIAKRLGVEDTNSDSSSSEGLGDESLTLWLLWYAKTLRRGRAHMCGAWVKIFGVPMDSKEKASHNYALIRREVVT